MLHYFPDLRTQRITAKLKELTIGESIKLASFPEHRHEASCTAFLRNILESAQGVTDPIHWTVQERNLAIAHYQAAVAEDGPDFPIGSGRYSDYLDGEADRFIAEVEIGEFAGDHWSIRQLTGAMAESIERLAGTFELSGRRHWIWGGMAAQLIRKGEDIPEFTSESQHDEWLLQRMRVFSNFPESEFELLIGGYFAGLDALHHLFTINFNDRGIVVMPKKGADGSLPPARFPVSACLSQTALDLAG